MNRHARLWIGAAVTLGLVAQVWPDTLWADRC